MKNRGFSGKVKVRFKRAWRGYKPGDEIAPPAALREELLRTKTPLGEPVAEVVDVPTDAAAVEDAVGAPAETSSEAEEKAEQPLLDEPAPKKGGRGKGKKE